MYFFFSSRRRHTRLQGDWSSDVCSSDLPDPFIAHGCRFNAMQPACKRLGRVSTRQVDQRSWLPRTRDGMDGSPRAHWSPDNEQGSRETKPETSAKCLQNGCLHTRSEEHT